jgi:NAD(P)H dehydrogenase (quinone)
MQKYAKPRALIIGSTGRIGGRLIVNLERESSVQVVRTSHKQSRVDLWHQQGKDSVLLDLDRPEGFAAALQGVDRLFLSTGYTVAMLQQSKT